MKKCIQELIMAKNDAGLPYVVIRCQGAGVFAGYLKKRKHQEVTLVECRRLWQWAGAASLSQLAMEGVSKPDQCKFPPYTHEHVLMQTIEVIPMTIKAMKSIKDVPEWRA